MCGRRTALENPDVTENKRELDPRPRSHFYQETITSFSLDKVDWVYFCTICPYALGRLGLKIFELFCTFYERC